MTLSEERARVAALLACIPIERVISVDDHNAPGVHILINLGRTLSGEQRANVLDMPEMAESLEDHQAFQEAANRRWEGWDAHERAESIQRAQKLSGDSYIADDTEDLSKLKELMPHKFFESVPLAGWKSTKDTVINTDKPVLVLFDRDFTDEGEGARTGEELLAELQQATTSKLVWTGLVSHTVTAANEHATYLELTEHLDAHRTIVISKARLTDNGDFAGHLRSTLLAPLLHSLLERVAKHIDDVREAALQDLREVKPYELESMVFGASRVEGVWEPDTLLLLFELLQRQRIRKAVHGDSEVAGMVATLRRLGSIELAGASADQSAGTAPQAAGGSATATASHDGHPAKLGDPQKGQALRSFQRMQIYDDIAHINSLHMPIELGDIFDGSKRKRHWIAIAQPCDLMVRADGSRADSNTHAWLAPIEKLNKNGPRATDFLLPYFDEHGRDYVVKLPLARPFRLCLLDLAVFDDDGSASFKADASPPQGLIEGWRKRHALIASSLRHVLDLYGRCGAAGGPVETTQAPQQRDELETAVIEALAGDGTVAPFHVTVDIQTGTVSAGCKRAGRLSSEYGRALLQRWAAHMARPVLPYDLTRGAPADSD